jgi:hypothetical protein
MEERREACDFLGRAGKIWMAVVYPYNIALSIRSESRLVARLKSI